MSASYLILSQLAGRYYLYEAESGKTFWASARGLFRKQKIKPLPGDWAEVEPSGDPDCPQRLVALAPRRNELIRPPIANLDSLIIVASLSQPEIDYYLVDRLIALARSQSIAVSFVLTKADLPAAGEKAASCALFLRNYRQLDYPLYILGEGEAYLETLQALKASFKGKLVALCGQSGVGKSSLLNRILGSQAKQTGELSLKAGRGRQTTRQLEIFPYENFYLADSPGFQCLELEQSGLDGVSLLQGYPELLAIADRCYFNNCRHLGEKKCAVDEAKIAPERLQRYRELRRRLDEIKPY